MSEENATAGGFDGAEGAGEHKETESKATEERTLTQAEVDQIIADRLKRERDKYKDYSDLKQKASELDKLQEAQKSETQKLNDQLAEAQSELQALRVEKVRADAARQAGLDSELAEYITAAEPETALAQAKKLAERLKPKPADLKQGVRQTAKPAPTADDWIRQISGRH